MTVDKVFYTDGHDVTVTDSMLTVKKKTYRLAGITRHGLSVLKPVTVHGWVLIVAGMILSTLGAMKVFPTDWIRDVRFAQWIVGENVLALSIGVFLMIIGLLFISLTRAKYAVRIATAEGESDVVVSKQREYVRQIVDGLNRAYVAINSRGKNSQL